MRRYERSKPSGTTTAALDEDIKTAALEAFVPHELEQDVAMNHARLRFEAKFMPTLKPAEVSSHSRQLLQRTLEIQWMRTALQRRQEKQEGER